MKRPHFALNEISGLVVDLAVTCIMIFAVGIHPLAARLPGAAAGIATSWKLNRNTRDEPGEISAFLMTALTVTSRAVGVGLFCLLQWRNPLIQPLIPLGLSSIAACVLAIYGYRRLLRQKRGRD